MLCGAGSVRLFSIAGLIGWIMLVRIWGTAAIFLLGVHSIETRNVDLDLRRKHFSSIL